MKQTRRCGCWYYHRNRRPCFVSLQTHCSYITNMRDNTMICTKLQHRVREETAGFVDVGGMIPFSVQMKIQLQQSEGSNASADLPTDASTFTASWLSCGGEGWFASFILYFKRWQVQNDKTQRQPDRYKCRKRWRHAAMNVRILSGGWSPERRCVPLTSQSAFLRWNRGEQTALAAVDGFLQGDCSLTLQTGSWYDNNKDTVSQSETLLFDPRGQRTSTRRSIRKDCHCHWGPDVSQVRFTLTTTHN